MSQGSRQPSPYSWNPESRPQSQAPPGQYARAQGSSHWYAQSSYPPQGQYPQYYPMPIQPPPQAAQYGYPQQPLSQYQRTLYYQQLYYQSSYPRQQLYYPRPQQWYPPDPQPRAYTVLESLPEENDMSIAPPRDDILQPRDTSTSSRRTWSFGFFSCYTYEACGGTCLYVSCCPGPEIDD